MVWILCGVPGGHDQPVGAAACSAVHGLWPLQCSAQGVLSPYTKWLCMGTAAPGDSWAVSATVCAQGRSWLYTWWVSHNGLKAGSSP